MTPGPHINLRETLDTFDVSMKQSFTNKTMSRSKREVGNPRPGQKNFPGPTRYSPRATKHNTGAAGANGNTAMFRAP